MMKYITLSFLFNQGQLTLIQPGIDIIQRSVSTSNERFWTSIMKENICILSKQKKLESSSLQIISFMKIINNIGVMILT